MSLYTNVSKCAPIGSDHSRIRSPYVGNHLYSATSNGMRDHSLFQRTPAIPIPPVLGWAKGSAVSGGCAFCGSGTSKHKKSCKCPKCR